MSDDIAFKIVADRHNIVNERDLHEAARKLENYAAEPEKTIQPRHTLGTPHNDSQVEPREKYFKLLN